MIIRVIQCDYNGHWEDIPTKRDALAAKILALAKTENAAIHFHQVKKRSFFDKDAKYLRRTPVVILECEEAFFEKVKKLGGIHSTYDVWKGISTERTAKWMKYFSYQAARSKGPKTP